MDYHLAIVHTDWSMHAGMAKTATNKGKRLIGIALHMMIE